MSFQKLIQSTFLNKNKKEKKITLNGGKEVYVKSGDILYVTIQSEDGSSFFRARFIDVKDNGDIWVYLLNSNDDFVDFKVSQNRIEKIESSN